MPSQTNPFHTQECLQGLMLGKLPKRKMDRYSHQGYNYRIIKKFGGTKIWRVSTQVGLSGKILAD